ncbi:MAG: hypothetical protein LBG89_02665 [Rickettsiales bacterium]|nr:hypothetical protein [Rickettsiales bacterium]
MSNKNEEIFLAEVKQHLAVLRGYTNAKKEAFMLLDKSMKYLLHLRYMYNDLEQRHDELCKSKPRPSSATWVD